MRIIMFLRTNCICKHNLTLKQRLKVLQVKHWSSQSTPSYLTLPIVSFSLDSTGLPQRKCD